MWSRMIMKKMEQQIVLAKDANFGVLGCDFYESK